MSGGRSTQSRVLAIQFVRIIVVTLLLGLAGNGHALELELPDLALTNVATEVAVTNAAPNQFVVLSAGDRVVQRQADENGRVQFDGVVFAEAGSNSVTVSTASGESATGNVRVLFGWVSILPPLIAIFIALALKNVIPALIVGIWIGATALRSFDFGGLGWGLLDSFEVYVADALADADHASLILFSFMIGGMVGIITRNGGMASIVRLMLTKAKNAVGGQVSVWAMGIMIFFDDYSNTLVVGNTARPLTDRLRISREKLAYIVDSTAAPVVCIALITTWIGYEVGLIQDSVRLIPEIDQSAYTIFLYSIPYSFYPILAVLYVFAIARSGRDYGPMYKAEVRARGGQVSPVRAEDLPSMQGENLEPKPGVEQRAWNAFIPIIVVIVALISGLVYTGEGDSLQEIIGSANAYRSMMWASFAGALTAATLTIAQGLLNTHETVDAWYGGVRAMFFAMIILVLSWSLAAVTANLHTADYLVSILADTLPIALVPATVFAISAVTAFTTGTSWGTMGILMPLVIPLSWAVMGVNGMQDPEHMHILYSAIACNLAGAVWGDHCSPISDTTVLSSLASGCDHIEHVRTQMPYATTVAVVAIAVGTIPGGYGFPPLLSILIGLTILVTFLRYAGKRADDAVSAQS